MHCFERSDKTGMGLEQPSTGRLSEAKSCLEGQTKEKANMPEGVSGACEAGVCHGPEADVGAPRGRMVSCHTYHQTVDEAIP